MLVSYDQLGKLEKLCKKAEHNKDRLVEKDHYTNDIRYNSGLKLLKENSYLFVCGNPDVEYYCMCNGYD